MYKEEGVHGSNGDKTEVLEGGEWRGEEVDKESRQTLKYTASCPLLEIYYQ